MVCYAVSHRHSWLNSAGVLFDASFSDDIAILTPYDSEDAFGHGFAAGDSFPRNACDLYLCTSVYTSLFRSV